MSLNFKKHIDHLIHFFFKEGNIRCKWTSNALGFLWASLNLKDKEDLHRLLGKATKDRLLIYDNKLSLFYNKINVSSLSLYFHFQC